MARDRAQKRSACPFFPRSQAKRILPERVVFRLMAVRSARRSFSQGKRMERFSRAERREKARDSLTVLVKLMPWIRDWP